MISSRFAKRALQILSSLKKRRSVQVMQGNLGWWLTPIRSVGKVPFWLQFSAQFMDNFQVTGNCWHFNLSVSFQNANSNNVRMFSVLLRYDREENEEEEEEKENKRRAKKKGRRRRKKKK